MVMEPQSAINSFAERKSVFKLHKSDCSVSTLRYFKVAVLVIFCFVYNRLNVNPTVYVTANLAQADRP